MIKISVYRNDELLNEFEQAGDKEITIGRAAGCSIHLDEASVSRLHAVLVNQGGNWSVVRKANFGAVLLNGQEIENAPVEGGEELAIGEFSLRINIEGGREKSASVVASQSMEVSEDGGTKIMTAGVNGLLRFEPGTANVAEFLMESPLAVFGRGSNCDVVLTEKKASRKHFEIRKQGLSFILKDLNSANGTQVNGRPVQEQELVSGDVIQIGEAKIQFSVENRDYFSKQDQFMPVPAHLEQSLAVPEAGGEAVQYGADGNPIENAGLPGMDQAGAASAAPPPTSLIGKAKFWYSSLPKERRLRLIAIFTALALLGAIFGTGDEPAKKTRGPKGPGGARVYENLTPEKKKFVRDNYEQLNKAYATRDYPKMLEFTAKILTYVDDYNDTKNYEMIAKKGLEQQEEEKRRKALEEKQAATRKEVAALEEKGRALLAKALDDPKFRPELDTLIQEIYAKDPNNRAAADWKAQIKAKDEEDKRLAEDARKKEEIKQRAEAAFADVEKTFKDEKYIQALAQAETLYDQEYKDKAYTDRIDKLKEEIRTKLSTVITPYLREAEAQRQEGGDLVKAKEAYMQVLKIDATNKEARRGLDDIHDKLHLRAKRYYNEAILADSMSDLVEAKEKYEKCLHSAPDDKDIYRVRCRSKLSRFEAFTPESGGGQ